MADPLVQAFFEEATELLIDFEAGLLELEGTPGDGELLNRIFRAAHTLKGNSAMLGFENVAHFTHVLEDLLDQLRKGRRPATPRAITGLLSAADAVRALLEAARDGRTDGVADDTGPALAELRALLDGEDLRDPAPAAPAAPAPGPAPAAGSPRTLYEIVFRPPADVLLRGLDPLALVAGLGELGEVLQTTALVDGVPALEDMDPERSVLGWRVWLLGTAPPDAIERYFEFATGPGALTIEALPMDGPADAPDRPAEGAARPAAESAPGAAVERRAASAGGADATSIRVPVEKVDRLVNLVGELVITQSMVAQLVTAFTPEKLAALREAVGLMDRHARELHERLMAVRMIPIRSLFARFPRLVRDLAAAVGKSAVLELAGEDTELDKTVIERMSDPLTHLVRNAVDHGLEPPEGRAAAGKPAAGRVRLEAYQQGGSIYIEIRDDGRGLDRARILDKAVEQGLVGADAAPSDEETFALIMRPGFSTAEKITEVSGRGVGMDVVKRNVEALGGSIAIVSTPGRGTTFRIKLPLTLAILDGQSLRVGAQTYIVPLVSVVESVRPDASAVKRVFGLAEGIVLRGAVIPVLRLHRLFGVPGAVERPADGLLVVVEHEGARVALLVDELLGQQQVVIKSLETNFEKVEGVAGATILGDGHVALILDVPGLIVLGRGLRAAA